MIFVSLASYRDPELAQTIESAYTLADRPSELVFGVYSQVAKGEHPDLSKYPVREIVVPHTAALGAGYARSKVQELYQDEQWYLQVDAHTLFTQSWDTRFIQWAQLTGGVISGWSAPYSYDNGEIAYNRHEQGVWEWFPHYTVPRSYKHSWIGGRVRLKENFGKSQVLLGGMVFAPGQWAKDIAYDPRIPFWGEEFNLSIRTYCAGYDIYSVNDLLLYHNYVRHGTVRAWDDIAKWDALSLQGIKAQRDILCLKETGVYRLKSIPRYFDYMNLTTKYDYASRAQRLYEQGLKGD